MSEIITIDGPSSSGKDTVGKMLAQKLGYQFIDTGAMYRAFTLFNLEKNISLNDSPKVTQTSKQANMEFKIVNGGQRVFLNNQDVTDLLHSKKVTDAVPIIAAIPEVRVNAKQLQRKLAEQKDTVMAGRDIGTVIFPDAKLKFFITASSQVRAQRRWQQQKSSRPDVTLKQIQKEIEDRDQKDSTRSASPLKVPDGAIIIDTSNLDINQTLDELLKHCRLSIDKNSI